MKILTGNDLKSGDVLWWDGTGWSRHFDDAADAGADADAILTRESAAQRVNAAYLVDGERSPVGLRLAHIKERIRALGPTVRLDLSLDPAASPTRVL